MKTVLTYGTFDLFHYGHYNLLKRAKSLGDYLIVGVSSDELCRIKGKESVFPVEKRMEIVSDLRFVDKVIVEHNMAQKVSDALIYHASVFCLGSDYKDIFPSMPEYQRLIDIGCSVVFFERTPNISSTELKNKLKTGLSSSDELLS